MIVISKKGNTKVQNIQDVAGFEIVRLNMREMKKETATFSMTQRNLTSNKIKMAVSELTRIVAAFNPDILKTNKKYPYIKDLILL